MLHTEQHARNPARTVVIGGNRTVFAPAYGSPFVRSLDEGRRYAKIEDFRIGNMPSRVHALGDLWAPVAAKRGRFDLERFLKPMP